MLGEFLGVTPGMDTALDQRIVRVAGGTGDLLAAGGVDSRASRRGGLLAAEHKHEAEEEHHHTSSHEDVADKGKVDDPTEIHVYRECQNGSDHEQRDSCTDTHDDPLRGEHFATRQHASPENRLMTGVSTCRRK